MPLPRKHIHRIIATELNLTGMSRIASIVGLITALLIIGVTPALAAGSIAGTDGQTSTPACSNPPSQLGWYALDTSSSPAVPVAGPAHWDADTVSIGYETTGPAAGFFVVSDDSGKIIGTQYVEEREAGHTDGLTIDLKTNLSGVETVQVNWHCDANGNAEYDPDVDYAAGPRAEPTAIDFGAVATTPMTTNVNEDTGQSMSPTSDATSPGQPGFSYLSSLLAIVGIIVLIRYR